MFQLLVPETRISILDAREKHLTTRLAKLAAVETNFPLDRYAKEVTAQFRRETRLELDWIKHLRGRNSNRQLDSQP
jgi:hypothetical protein